jgi:putative hydrolase
VQPFDPIGDDDDPFGEGMSFEGLPPFFTDLGRLFSYTGPLNFDIAQQTAVWAANEGEAEPNVDPMERMRIEELLRIAELHVAETTGMSTSLTGQSVRAITLTRAEWSSQTLEAYRHWLEALGNALTGSFDSMLENVDVDDLPPELFDTTDPAVRDQLSAMFANMGQVLRPALIGIQSGMMVGHLAQRSFGAYDLPLPRPRSDELLFIPRNIDDFAKAWSLPEDDLRLWVCLSQLTHHIVLGIPHVANRIGELVMEYVSNFEAESDSIERHLGAFNPEDPSSIQLVFDDPNAILGSIQTPAQQRSYEHLQAIVSAMEGYVDYVVATTGEKLIATYGQLEEALLRHRVEENEGERFVEKLFGLSMGQELFDRGTAFAKGVIERAGPNALGRLWTDAESLPTPNEIDAPGLWLARIDLPITD